MIPNLLHHIKQNAQLLIKTKSYPKHKALHVIKNIFTFTSDFAVVNVPAIFYLQTDYEHIKIKSQYHQVVPFYLFMNSKEHNLLHLLVLFSLLERFSRIYPFLILVSTDSPTYCR